MGQRLWTLSSRRPTTHFELHKIKCRHWLLTTLQWSLQHTYTAKWLICVSKITIIGWDNGLSPDRRQAMIWTSAGILLVGPLGPSFSWILIEIDIFSFKKMHLEISFGKWRPFCLGHIMLMVICRSTHTVSYIFVKVPDTCPFYISNTSSTTVINVIKHLKM